MFTLPPSPVFHNGRPTAPEEVLADLRAHGVPEPFIEKYFATARFGEWDEDKHPREPGGGPNGGQFAPAGGGGDKGDSGKGAAVATPAGKLASPKDVPAKGVEQAMAAAKPVAITNPGIASRITSSILGKVKDKISKAADAAAEGVKHLVYGAASLNPIGALARGALTGAIGVPDWKASKHYEKMVDRYGKRTANLIYASAYGLSAAASLGTFAAMVTTTGGFGPAVHALGRAAAGAAAGYLIRTFPRIATVPGQMIAKVVHGALGNDVRPPDQRAKDAAKHSWEPDWDRWDFEAADFATAKDKDDIITLQPQDIHRLGAAVANDVNAAFCEKLASEVDWKKVHECMQKGGKAEHSADVEVYYNGVPTALSLAEADLARSGFSAEDAERWAATLELV